MTVSANEAKARVASLLNYIKEIKNRLDLPILDESSYDWNFNLDKLPNHPSITLSPSPEIILQLRKPAEKKCPQPPSSLKEWLRPSWGKVNSEIEILDSLNIQDADGKIKTLFFNENLKLKNDLEGWRKIRDDWRKAELPSEEVRQIFSKLHELKGWIDKESEKKQLYLTEGVLSVNSLKGKVHHPLIFKEITIELETNKTEPEFIVKKSEVASFLYVDLLRQIGINGNQILKRKNEFNELDIDPDQKDKTSDFLRSLVHFFWQDGEFSDVPVTNTQKPTIFNELKIILGKKQDHFTEQIDNYLKALPSLTALPAAFENIVGKFNEFINLPPLPEVDDDFSFSKNNVKKEYFLTKEFNLEQKKIIDLLDSKGCVSVQGPPGTGKSHTIANLIGHLLAKGNSVLVSSHTTKALNVIRNQVVEELRPLCVSILENSSESKKQLQESVNFIDEMLTRTNEVVNSSKRVDVLKSKKNDLEKEIDLIEKQYANLIINEYKPISYQGQAILPKDAAKFVEINKEQNLIEHPLLLGSPPITDIEFEDIKKIISRISPTEQDELENEIPDLKMLIRPEDLKQYNDHQRSLDEKFIKTKKDIILGIEKNPATIISEHYEKLISITNIFTEEEEWRQYILETLLRGSDYAQIVQDFVTKSSELLNEIEEHSKLIWRYNPSIDTNHDSAAIEKVLMTIASYGTENVKFDFFYSLFSTEVKIIRECARVGTEKPSTAVEYLSIVHFLRIKKLRERLLFEWRALFQGKIQIGDIGIDIEEPENKLKYLVATVNDQIYSVRAFEELIDSLKTIGIVWPTKNHEKIKSDIKSKYKNILTISSELNDVILPSLEMAFLKQKINQFETSISSSIKYLKNSKYNNKIAKSLLETLKSIDFIKYEVFFAELLVLSNKVPEYTRLLALITKLEVGSPFFSKNIITRQVDSLISKINNFSVSWKISFLDYTIEERNKISPTELQDVLKEKQAQLKMINKDLIFCLVEKNQIERTGPEQRQALRGWVQTQNKITKQGTGVLDDFRRKESRNLLRKCKSAVPVWIMPLKRVLDNFNLVDDSFDVLIIDEASQADLTNLPVFSIAKKVIVVGDDKQVSPSGAGVKLVGLESLIDEFLKEIPNKQNYDFKFSLYDVACSSFGDTVRLSEHFRCVPEIIQFCNDLSYNGMIKVLRESKNNPIPKATVAHYVDGQNEDDINKAEAETITSLILCMKDRPEYANKSFGVISLKGQFQHQYIDQLLRLNLTSKEYEDLKIICGKAPQFQGDERDVIFLSLVESPKSEGPLTLQSDTDERKKEYNVAVSRARNKLWVLHSMNPHTHLKPEDLRLRLLKHVENPISLVEKYSEQAKMAESPFEKSVHEDLARAGYKFIPQYKIGAYRIDIVLFASDGTRIAIECDGDKFHSGEEKIREDLQRQSVLERMNVKFIRVRGSDYYRKREKTLNNIFQKLKLYNVLIDFSSDVVSIDTNLKTQEIISEAEKIRLNLLGVEFDTTDLNFKKRSMKV